MTKGKPASDAVICPPPGEDPFEADPPPAIEVAPCWSATIASGAQQLQTSKDAVGIARAVLALAERPHRLALATRLVEQLRRVSKLDRDGELDVALESRSSRALVYAALLRAQTLGTGPASAASQDVLFGKLAVLRDVDGGYGSSTATLAVVRALLASQLSTSGTSRVRVDGGAPVDVPADGSVVVPLAAGAREVRVRVSGPALVARLERPILRSWTRPPPGRDSRTDVEVVWPADLHAGSTAPLRILLKQGQADTSEVDVRIPLPPGVLLAAPVTGVTPLQGVLAIRANVPRTGGAVLEAPLRFGLAGTMTVPESIARLTRSPGGPSTAPSRTLVVR